MNVNPSDLKADRRGIEYESRDSAMYLIRTIRSKPAMRIGANFGSSQYSFVNSAVIRVYIKLYKDKKLKPGALILIQYGLIMLWRACLLNTTSEGS